MKKILYAMIATAMVLASCEEVENPIAGIEQTDLFVQLGANTPDSTSLTEGTNFSDSVTIQAPISAEEDLLATLVFGGDAVYGTDFIINSKLLESADENGATLRVPFLPAEPNNFVTDQVSFLLTFPDNFVQDGTKELIITLTGAVGSENSALTFAGGRGSIRREFYIEIGDNDCGNLAGLYTVTGETLVSDFAVNPTYTYDEALGLTDCTVEGTYPVFDVTGGLWSQREGDDSYSDLYNATARSTNITINPNTNVVTWPTLSDEFGGNIVQDSAQPASNYDAASNTITLYWEATGFGERGITTYVLQ